jgi:hypothetical protein
MPRGGRRRGAGARKGNFNAMRGAHYSQRAWIVLFRLMTEPDQRAVGFDLLKAGLLKPPPDFFDPKDTRRVVEFLWRRWFDRPAADQSTSIKEAPPAAAIGAAAPTPQIHGPAGAPAIPAPSGISPKTKTIK